MLVWKIMFSTLVQFALHSCSLNLRHVVDTNGLKGTFYGWYSMDDMGQKNHMQTLGSGGPPFLHALGWILDGISLLVFFVRQCYRYFSNYRHESEVQNRQWTGIKMVMWLPHFLGVCAKGGGCVWYVCITTEGHHFWCCLLSFFSMWSNIKTAALEADAVNESGQSW